MTTRLAQMSPVPVDTSHPKRLGETRSDEPERAPRPINDLFRHDPSRQHQCQTLPEVRACFLQAGTSGNNGFPYKYPRIPSGEREEHR